MKKKWNHIKKQQQKKNIFFTSPPPMQALSTLFTAATLPSFNQFFFLHSLFKKKKRKKEKEKRRANAKTISVQMGEYSLLSPLSSLNRDSTLLTKSHKMHRMLLDWKHACQFIGTLESSQPQRIISGLKANFSLSPTYSAPKSSNHKFSEIYKISPDINYTKQNIHTQTSDTVFFFWRINPFGIAPV